MPAPFSCPGGILLTAKRHPLPSRGGKVKSGLAFDSHVGGDPEFGVTSTLAIGDFSRATFLSVRMLRHYHELGLLEPIDVDVDTGYRRYAPEQIVTAQVIRRFRDLDMPLEDIQVVLQAPDVETRNRVITNHLARLESDLARTQDTVASLRSLLDPPQGARVPIDHRYVAAMPAAFITDVVDTAHVVAWYRGAMGEVAATLSAQDISPSGLLGG